MIKRTMLLATLLPALTYGQLRWHPAANHQQGLPAGVRVFETTDSLDGKAFRAFYLEADLHDKSLDFVIRTGDGRRYTPAQYDSIEGPGVVAVMNTTFFSFKDNSNLNIVIRDGKVVAVNPQGGRHVTRGAFGIDRKRRPDVAWVYNVGEKNRPYAYPVPATGRIDGKDTTYPVPDKRYPARGRKWKMREAVGGGPVLVQNGKPHVTAQEEGMSASIRQFHPRSAIGYTADDKVILLVIEGRHKGVAEGANFEQMAKIFTDLGCVEALNLDGGGSSALYVQGKNTILPSDPGGQRPVPAVFMIKRK
ncbi:phosphodiester glycosidase family protein [Chitinophaga lutea]